jgi:hypothetical protein
MVRYERAYLLVIAVLDAGLRSRLSHITDPMKEVVDVEAGPPPPPLTASVGV